MLIKHIRHIALPTCNSASIILKSVLHIPQVWKILFSITKLTKDDGCKVEFSADNFVKNVQMGDLLLKGLNNNARLYV